MATSAKILLFHMEPNKTRQIEAVCRSLKIQTIKVKPTSYKQKLGYLAGIMGFSRENATYTGPDFPTEMLVFSGMDSEKIDTFLEQYKKASIPPIGLKAIITQHNIFWTAEELYKELFKEHSKFNG